MARNRLSPSRRREDIRAWWGEHLTAQRKSGQTQAAYCRAQGLDPKYFTLATRATEPCNCRRPMNLPNSAPPQPAAALFNNLEYDPASGKTRITGRNQFLVWSGQHGAAALCFNSVRRGPQVLVATV
jgi:hypothetical protein